MFIMMKFIERLNYAWDMNNSLVCVWLDPNIEKFPTHIKQLPNSIFEFNKAIIDATHDLVCAYKPQIAYYAWYGAEDQLKMTLDYIKVNYPEIPVILDAKRNDIWSTAEMYAKEVFERYWFDAVTVNPYMWTDTIEPFYRWKDRWTIVLCRTSNPNSWDFQNLMIDGEELYKKVARFANDKWNQNNNILLVVGATYPKEMKELRELASGMCFLVPGVGAQGGDVEMVVKNGCTVDGKGLIINSWRAIIYASSWDDFMDVARMETIKLRDQINQFR